MLNGFCKRKLSISWMMYSWFSNVRHLSLLLFSSSQIEYSDVFIYFITILTGWRFLKIHELIMKSKISAIKTILLVLSCHCLKIVGQYRRFQNLKKEMCAQTLKDTREWIETILITKERKEQQAKIEKFSRSVRDQSVQICKNLNNGIIIRRMLKQYFENLGLQ